MKWLVFAAIAGWLLASSAASIAQTQRKPVRIGWIVPSTLSAGEPNLRAFRAGLAAHGYIEGRDFVMVQRSADGVLDRLPVIAEEIPTLDLDLVVSLGAAISGLRDRITTIPVVYAISGDPVAAGLADSLSRPRRNLTGVTFMAIDLNEKRLELLLEILPTVRRVVLLGNPVHPGAHLEVEASQDMARRLGIEIRWHPIRTNAEFEALLSAMDQDPPDALVMLPDMVMLGFRERIAEFALRHRIPAVSGWSAFAHSGGLFTYGPRLPESYRRLADYADRILKGARPADLPVERPSLFELVINLKTANALGIKVPAAVLARADEVIE